MTPHVANLSGTAVDAMIVMADVEKWYGAYKALSGINLEVRGARGSSCAGLRDRASRRSSAASTSGSL